MQAWIRRPQEDEFDRWTKQPQAAYWRLIGEGGGGKTSLLARFFEEAEDRRFPAVFLEANRCLDRGERDGVTLLLNLETVNTPTFDAARRLLLGVKSAFQAALDEAGGQTKANWDRISELAECGAEGAGAILKGARDVAKVVEVIFGKGREASRAQNLAQPEQFLLLALADDMAKGGVWLIDTWEQADAKPFTTRLEFPAVGRLRTPLRGKPTETTLAPWLEGVLTWMFTKTKLLALIAGREAPGTLGGDWVPPVRGVTERTQPWNETEIAAFLADALREIDHGDAPLSDLRRRTGGVPLLVDWVARLVGDVAREQGGDWRWAEWPRLVRDFAESDRYGLIHYAVERVVKQSARIADVWKLALVDELTPAVADILFPPAGRDGPTGRELLRELGRLGLARRVRGQPDRWLVHDVTRSALESYAAYEEKLGGPETLETHRALADHYDREAGWTTREEAEFCSLVERGKVPDNWAPASISKAQFATLIRAAFHRTIVVLYSNPEMDGGKVKPSFIYEMGRRLASTIRFSPPWVRAIGGLRFGSLSKNQIKQLLEVFKSEGGLESGFEPEDAHLFHRIAIAESINDINDINFERLIGKYRESSAALIAIGEGKVLPLRIREEAYARMIENKTSNQNHLASYAVFLWKEKNLFDEAEVIYKRVIDSDLVTSIFVFSFALFMANIRKKYEDAEFYMRKSIQRSPHFSPYIEEFARFLYVSRRNVSGAETCYRRALEVSPSSSSILGSFAWFIQEFLDEPDQAEIYYKRAIRVDPWQSSNLANLAWFMHSIKHNYDEAEIYYQHAAKLDPYNANNFSNFAWFQRRIRNNQKIADIYYRYSVVLAPSDCELLGNLSGFLWYVKKDFDRAEAFYRRSIVCDGGNARIIGEFAWFLRVAKNSYEESKNYYKFAISVNPSNIVNLIGFAAFFADILNDCAAAEIYYRRAVDVEPNHANGLGNLAGLLFARDSLEEAELVWQHALTLADTGPDTLTLELWFYAYAHLPHRRDEALREVTARLERGERSPNFDLSRNVEAARRQGHPAPDLVADLARRIGE
jgi:tetratricopeptide (TPR) repeat protein